MKKTNKSRKNPMGNIRGRKKRTGGSNVFKAKRKGKTIGKFKSSSNKNTKSGDSYIGRFMASKKQYGFVRVDNIDEDFFIAGPNKNTACNNDIVEIRTLPKKGGRTTEATVVNIIDRACKFLIGKLEKAGKRILLIPFYSKDIVCVDIISLGDQEISPNDYVIAELIYSKNGNGIQGRVKSVLRGENLLKIPVLTLVLEAGVPYEFPDKVINQARNVSSPVTKMDIDFRKDLRDLVSFTIDGEDTKDFDDAVSIDYDGEIYTLWVHIADVANYVQEKSALDKEALKRGTSIYLDNSVIPMLPFELSNGICSLVENENRLALSAYMEIDNDGRLCNFDIFESVIKINKRLTYEGVADYLSNGGTELLEYDKELKLMRRLADRLSYNRRQRGAIFFDNKEAKLIYDENGRLVDIYPATRNVATSIIEEFMIYTNEAVASFFCLNKLPFLYRVHEKPDIDKLNTLLELMKLMGYNAHIDSKNIEPRELVELLSMPNREGDKQLIDAIALRCMKQAIYSDNNTGHFGLASSCYCHFTSPIRRYPDLQIHRIIKDYIRQRLNQDKINHYKEILPEVAASTSKTERLADNVERDVLKLKKAEYMQDKIGCIYRAIVSHITSSGLYATIDSIIEGFIPIGYIDSSYIVDDNIRLYSRFLNKSIYLGDEIVVRVINVSIMDKRIDFELIEDI